MKGKNILEVITVMNPTTTIAAIESIRSNIQKVIIGKETVIDLILTSLIAGGHILLEDVPGTGKTVMAKSLAKSVSGAFSRIQFTPDLLPSDVTGLNYFNQKAGEFVFREGPVFCNILLADEINRATPRTQSALLECMEEKQVTVDGVTHQLAQPFFVIATQNPIETSGTFPLPEAQLDRFLMQLSMGTPSKEEELALLERFLAGQPLETLSPVCTTEELIGLQQAYPSVYVHPSLLSYRRPGTGKPQSQPSGHWGQSTWHTCFVKGSTGVCYDSKQRLCDSRRHQNRCRTGHGTSTGHQPWIRQSFIWQTDHRISLRDCTSAHRGLEPPMMLLLLFLSWNSILLQISQKRKFIYTN